MLKWYSPKHRGLKLRGISIRALTEVKRLSKESDVTVGILKGYVC